MGGFISDLNLQAAAQRRIRYLPPGWEEVCVHSSGLDLQLPRNYTIMTLVNGSGSAWSATPRRMHSLAKVLHFQPTLVLTF